MTLLLNEHLIGYSILCRIICEVIFLIFMHEIIYLVSLCVSTFATGLTMAPGRRFTRSMPPVVVDDQSRCCRGETSDSSSPRNTPIHNQPVGEASVPSEPSTPHTPSSIGNVYYTIFFV